MDDGEQLWAQLSADLDSQWDAAQAAQLHGEADERVRAERLATDWVSRLRASMGRSLSLNAQGLGALDGVLGACGPDWLLVTTSRGPTVLNAGSVRWIRGLAEGSVPEEQLGVVARRWRLVLLLGRLARQRVPVELVLLDGTWMSGTVHRVGSDAIDLVEHPLGEWARPDLVRGVRLVPTAGLAAVVLPRGAAPR